MADIIKKIKGTEDIMPKDSYRWIFLEDIMRRQANAYGYKEVRTPVFEQTSLFSREVWAKQLMLFKRKCTPLALRVTKA